MNWTEIFGDQSLQTLVGSTQELQQRLISTLVIIILLWLTRFLVVQFIDNRAADVRTRYTWRKMSVYVIAIIGVILLGRLWLTGMEAMITFLGLVSAGLAISLQGPLTDLAGWLFILSRRPFEVGDRIEIGEYAGDVVDVRIFQFTMLEIGNWVHADQSTGRILHIPNRLIFSEVLANYNKGFEYIWHEIEVLITFESDWLKAKAILDEIANQDAAHLSEDAAERVKRAARRFYIKYSKLTPIVYMRVASSGIMFTLRYLVEPRRRRATEQAIWEDILTAFAKHPEIEFAYPTQRFYQRNIERKAQSMLKSYPEDGASV